MTPVRIGKAAAAIAILFPYPAPAAVDAETTIAVTTTPNPVGERDSVQFQIVVDSPLTAVVTEPTFDAPDFIKAGSPEMKFQPHSGDFGPNTRKKLSFTYVLMPRHAGDFVIRNIGTKVGGQPLTSADVRVKVTADASGPRSPTPSPYSPPASSPPNDDEASNPAAPGYRPGGTAARSGGASVPDRFNSDFTVWASLNKTRAYVGEPIVVEYYLYDFGGLRQTEVLQWPNFTGFWREDLELNSQVQFEELYVKQQEVRRAFVARYALYGIKPGRIELDKLGIRGKYASSNALNSGIFFNNDLQVGQHYSQEVKVEILPLPETGRPANFGGAVGHFTLRLEANKQTLAQNTPVTFTFTLEGEGNFQAIDSIKLSLPPDFELYESTASGRQLAPVGTRQELASKKTFQTVAIPRKAGKFEVPAVSWSFFNPAKETYETIATQPILLEVTPNDATGTNNNTYLSPAAAAGAGAPATAPEELRFFKPVKLGAKGGTDPFTWVIAALAALNLALGIGFLRARSRKLLGLVKKVDRFSGARMALLQAKGSRDGEWQAGLEEVVLTTMQVLLDTNPRGLARSELEEMWRARNLPAAMFQRANALLDEIDRHRFSSQKLADSTTKESRTRMTKEAESLLSEAGRRK